MNPYPIRRSSRAATRSRSPPSRCPSSPRSHRRRVIRCR